MPTSQNLEPAFPMVGWTLAKWSYKDPQHVPAHELLWRVTVSSIPLLAASTVTATSLGSVPFDIRGAYPSQYGPETLCLFWGQAGWQDREQETTGSCLLNEMVSAPAGRNPALSNEGSGGGVVTHHFFSLPPEWGSSLGIFISTSPSRQQGGNRVEWGRICSQGKPSC